MTVNLPVKAAGESWQEAEVLGLRRDLLNNGGDFQTTTGWANAYVLTLDSQIDSLVAGMVVRFKANHTNTGAATLNINGLGAVNIQKISNIQQISALSYGDILADSVSALVYDGSNFQLLNPNFLAENAEIYETNDNLTAGQFVSFDYSDKTKVEKTRLENFQDGALDTTATGLTNVELIGINEKKALAVGVSGGQTQARIVTVNDDNTQTMNTLSGAIGSSLTPFKTLRLTETLYVVLAYNGSNIYYCVALELNLTTNSVTAGTAVLLPNATTHPGVKGQADIDRISDTTFISAYANTTSNHITAAVGSVSGVTITFGAETTNPNIVLSSEGVFVAALSATNAIAVFRNDLVTDQGARDLITMSGTTISSHALANISSSHLPRGIFKFTSTKAISIHADNSTGNPRVVEHTTAGADSTAYGVIQTANEADVYYRNVRTLYNDGSYLVILSQDASATLRTVSFNDSAKEANNINFLGIASADANDGVAVLSDFNSSYGLRLLVPQSANSKLVSHFGNFRSLAGIVNDSYSAGDADVYVYKRGLVTGLSGLTKDTDYYINENGELTTDKRLFYAGRALSTTSLFLDIKKTRNKTIESFPVALNTTEYGVVNLPVNDAWEHAEIYDGATTMYKSILSQSTDGTKTVNNLNLSLTLANLIKNPLFLEGENLSASALLIAE